MDYVTIGLFAIVGYAILKGSGALRAPTARAPSGGGAAISPGGGTVIEIPGVGRYVNLPNGTVTIGLDPRIFGLGASETPSPQPAAPSQTAAYDEAVNAAYAPISPYDWIPTAVPNEPIDYLGVV